MTIAYSVNNYQKSLEEEIYGMNLLKEQYYMLEIYDSFLDIDAKRGIYYGDEDERRAAIKEWKSVIKKAQAAAREKDWKTYNELSLLNGVYLYRHTQLTDYKYKDEYAYYSQYNDEVDKIIEKRNLTHIKVLDLAHNSTDVSNTTNADLSIASFIDTQYCIRLFDTLLDKGLAPINHYQVDSISIFFHTFNEIVPLLGVILICLLGFDSISKDKEMGTIKTIISSPHMRKRYMFVKTISTSCVSFIMLLLPSVLISVCLGAFDKFKMIFYPTLTFKEGLHSFQMAFNNIGDMEKMVDMGRMYSSEHYSGLVRHSLYGGDNMNWTALRSPDMSLDYMSLGLFLLFALVLLVLFILFLNSMTMFINIVIKSKTIGLCISLALCLLLYATTPITNTAVGYLFDPFSYKNAVEVVAGTTSYSFFSGIVVLSVYILILQIMGRIVMKKKDMN